MVRKGGLALDRIFRSGRNLTISHDRDPLKTRDPHESRVGPPYCPQRDLISWYQSGWAWKCNGGPHSTRGELLAPPVSILGPGWLLGSAQSGVSNAPTGYATSKADVAALSSSFHRVFANPLNILAKHAVALAPWSRRTTSVTRSRYSPEAIRGDTQISTASRTSAGSDLRISSTAIAQPYRLDQVRSVPTSHSRICLSGPKTCRHI